MDGVARHGKTCHTGNVRMVMKRNKKMLHTSSRAYSLIEMLIIIAILSVLILVVAAFDPIGYIKRGHDMRRKSDLELLRVANEEYYNTYGYYPSSLPQCGSSYMIGQEEVLPEVPCDPTKKIDYRYVKDETGKSRWYKIYTNLEYTEDPHITIIGCKTGCGPGCHYNYGVTSTNISVMTCDELVPPDQVTLLYVCAPGGGQNGSCLVFDNPERSECPRAYPNDNKCNQECSDSMLRCHDSTAKLKPHN